MQYGIIIGVAIYELVVILGVSAFLRKIEANALEQESGFALAGRNMGAIIMSPTIALTVLGAAHVLGVLEMVYNMGAISIWFPLGNVFMIVLACYGTGLWVRRLGVVTVPEIIKGMYGPGVAIAVTCTMAGQIFGVLTLECQGMGIVVSALTGWKIEYGIIAGGIIGILYVVFAGMKEVGVVNLINAVVMYIGLIVATAIVMSKLPGGNFTETVSVLKTDPNGGAYMLSILGTPNLMLTFGLGQILSIIFCQSISQMLMQTMMSAQNEKTIRKSVWFAAPLNGLFGVFTVCLGLAARSIPQYAAHGAKQAGMTMIVDMLPGGVAALLLAALLAAILSTFAMTALTPATMWVNDIYKTYINPEASEKKMVNMTRVLIIIIAVFAMFVSTALPTILDAIGWVFSWVTPIFFTITFGLFWKRNFKVTVTAITVAWVMNIVWTFTPIAQIIGGTIGRLPNAYVTLACTLIIFVIGNLASKGEPAYRKVVTWKEV